MSGEKYHQGLDSLGDAFNKAIDYHVREYQHINYKEPLNVQWKCRSCHIGEGRNS
jgi:hypothetical protein